jgi:hypothetical protein
MSSLTCNGTPVTPPTGSFSCNVSLNPGLNLVVLQGIDVAGNIALTSMHLGLNVALPPPTSLKVTPASVNLVVGDTQQFTVIDQQGRPRTDVSWTVSNNTIATVTTDPSPLLTTLAVGNVTLTATVQGVTAQAQVDVLAGTLTPGTASWTATPLPGLSASFFLQATPWIGGTPDLYEVEGSGSSPVLRAFTIDGQHLWQQAASSLSLYSFAPDAFGGLIATTVSGNGLIDLDGRTGSQVWQYSSQNSFSNPAVRPNGDILAIETDAKNTQLFADVFNGNTGQRSAIIPLPQSYATWHEEFHCTDGNGNPYVVITDGGGPTPYTAAPIVVDENGNGQVEYQLINEHDAYIHSTCGQNPMVTMETGTATIGLLQVSLDGSSSMQQVNSSNWSKQIITDSSSSSTEQDGGSFGFADLAIPDGQGGMLAAWVREPNVPAVSGQAAPIMWMITHTSNNGGGTFQLPLSASPSQLVLGESGAVFASNSTTIASFDMNSGAVNWTYQAPSGDQVSIISSSAGNGLAAKLISSSGSTVVRFDSSGNATSDPWAAVGIQNYGGNQWLGISNGNFLGISAAPVELSSAIWYAPDGNGGNAAVQNVSVTNFSKIGNNQTTVSNALQWIGAALPSYTQCNNWLQGAGQLKGISGAQDIQSLLSNNLFGHATVNVGNKPSYTIAAFSGTQNPDFTNIPGLPDGAAMTVNDIGSFFNPTDNQGNPMTEGEREYGGKTPQAQAAILVHEIAHQITVLGFQNDFGKSKAGKENDHLVNTNCRALIEAY